MGPEPGPPPPVPTDPPLPPDTATPGEIPSMPAEFRLPESEASRGPEEPPHRNENRPFESVHATVRALIEQTLSIATLDGSEAPFSMAILPDRKMDVDPAPFPPEGAEPGGRLRFPGTTPIAGAEGEVVGITTPCCAAAVTASRHRGTNGCINTILIFRPILIFRRRRRATNGM